jgi:hypothetical protein
MSNKSVLNKIKKEIGQLLLDLENEQDPKKKQKIRLKIEELEEMRDFIKG